MFSHSQAQAEARSVRESEGILGEGVFANNPEKGSINSVFMRFSLTIFREGL